MRTHPFLSCIPIATLGILIWFGGSGIDFPANAQDVKYNLVDLGVLPGMDASSAYALNDIGQVVGRSSFGSSVHFPFEWQNGKMWLLVPAEGTAYGINNANRVVGETKTGTTTSAAVLSPHINLSPRYFQPGDSWTARGINDNGQIAAHRFGIGILEPYNFAERLRLISENVVLPDGSFVDFGPYARAIGINSEGAMAGSYSVPFHEGYLRRAARFSPGLLSNTDELGLEDLRKPIGFEFKSAGGAAINSNGDVVGEANNKPVLWQGTRPKLLGTFGGQSGRALGINDVNQIVGEAQTEGGVYHGFFTVKPGDELADLNDVLTSNLGLTLDQSSVGWVVNSAAAINKSGEIVGRATTPTGANHGVLLSPARTVVLSVGVNWEEWVGDDYQINSVIKNKYDATVGDIDARKIRGALKSALRSFDSARSPEPLTFVAEHVTDVGQVPVNHLVEFGLRLKDVALSMSSDETLVLYLSSHGFEHDRPHQEHPYLLLNAHAYSSRPEDVDTKNHSDRRNDLTSEILVNALSTPELRSVRKIVIIEACHGGAFIAPLCNRVKNIGVLAMASSGTLAYSTPEGGIGSAFMHLGMLTTDQGRFNADLHPSDGILTLRELAKFIRSNYSLDPVTGSSLIGRPVLVGGEEQGPAIYDGMHPVFGVSADFIDGINVLPLPFTIPRLNVLYKSNFDLLGMGSLTNAPGATNQDSYFSGGSQNASCSVQLNTNGPPQVFDSPDRMLALVCSNSLNEGEFAVARRLVTTTGLASNPVVSLRVDFLAQSSTLNLSNAFEASVGAVQSDLGDVLRASITGGGMASKSNTGVNVHLTQFDGTNSNVPVPLNVGTNLAWDTWHSLNVVVDHKAGAYVSITVNGAHQDLAGIPLPRSFTNLQAFLPNTIHYLEHRLVAHPLPGQTSSDAILWDELSLSVGGEMIPPPTAVVNHVPPTIEDAPSSRTVAAGATAGFSISVSGSYPLWYQWYRNGTPIQGATNADLVFPSVQLANAGSYTVVISNLYGSVTNLNAANLTVSGGRSYSQWPMRQRDGENTGRAAFVVPTNRMGTNFFATVQWQKPTPGSPNDGNLGSSAMIYFDGAGPGGKDILVGTYYWPKGAQGMDRHSGELFWSGNPDGGESIGANTPAFSPDGDTIYLINDATPHPLMAFRTTNGPGMYWHNGSDPNPNRLGMRSPKVSPDGRIFAHDEDRPYGGTDNGTNVLVTWIAASGLCNFFSLPAITTWSNSLRVVGTGECGDIRAFDGVTGAQLWTINTGRGTDADPTVDPVNGNIYVAMGSGSVVVAGVSADGNPLWGTVTKPVFDHIPGANNPQLAASAGCLAHDGLTYYFQTVSTAGDGALYAVNTMDGSLKWTHPTASQGWQEPSASPIVTPNGVVIVGNNSGGTYFAIRDDGTNATLLAALALASGGQARSTPALADDGLLYIAGRQIWTTGNGDGNSPSQQPANLYTAFDLNATAPLAPMILTQPQGRTIVPGQSVTLSVVAEGTPPLYYSWRHAGTNLAGEIGPSLEITGDNLGTSDGDYQVTVTSYFGSATSAVATVSTVYPPVIITPPTNVSVFVASNAAFTVSAGGGMPLSYQWLFGGTNLTDAARVSGAQTSSLDIFSVQLGDTGYYQVLVTNNYGAVTSAVANLAVLLPGDGRPYFTQQPTNKTVAIGGTASLAAAVASYLPVTYQWVKNGTNLVGDVRISGTQTNILSIFGVKASDAGTYQLVAVNGIGATTSAVVVLTPRKIEYLIKDLGTLAAPFNGGSVARNLNNKGEVVGYAHAPGQIGNKHAFLFTSNSMIDLGVLAAPWNAFSDARAINDYGEIVGHAYGSNGNTRAFLYANGGMMNLGTLPTPFDRRSLAWGVSAGGAVLGDSYGLQSTHFFLYKDGVMTDLSSLLPPEYNDGNSARAINADGVVAVTAFDTNFNSRSFTISNGIVRDIGVLPAPFNVGCYVERINIQGDVVGECFDIDQKERAFVTKAGQIVDLGTLPSPFDGSSFAFSLNDYGDVVGAATTASGFDSRGFVYRGQQLRDLNEMIDPDFPLIIYTAVGINNSGQIAATAAMPLGSDHALLLTPVPSLQFSEARIQDGLLVSKLEGLVPGNTVVLESSTNLSVWYAIQTNLIFNTSWGLTNTVAPGVPNLFFRALVR